MQTHRQIGNSMDSAYVRFIQNFTIGNFTIGTSKYKAKPPQVHRMCTWYFDSAACKEMLQKGHRGLPLRKGCTPNLVTLPWSQQGHEQRRSPLPALPKEKVTSLEFETSSIRSLRESPWDTGEAAFKCSHSTVGYRRTPPRLESNLCSNLPGFLGGFAKTAELYCLCLQGRG